MGRVCAQGVPWRGRYLRRAQAHFAGAHGPALWFILVFCACAFETAHDCGVARGGIAHARTCGFWQAWCCGSLGSGGGGAAAAS